jgi:hypothetical protein
VKCVLALQTLPDLLTCPLHMTEIEFPIALARCANTDNRYIGLLHGLGCIGGCAKATGAMAFRDQFIQAMFKNWGTSGVQEFYFAWVDIDAYHAIPFVG